jgi:type II secretory ATPase GspE/PulE/Tfp pilus assembly ATPase PilB-like protein
MLSVVEKQLGGKSGHSDVLQVLFELLLVDDEMKKAILKYAGTPDEIRKFAKKKGHLGFQEEGILACAIGETSLQEVQKMMASK